MVPVPDRTNAIKICNCNLKQMLGELGYSSFKLSVLSFIFYLKHFLLPVSRHCWDIKFLP